MENHNLQPTSPQNKQQIIIGFFCLAFFPLVYIIGKTIASLL